MVSHIKEASHSLQFTLIPVSVIVLIINAIAVLSEDRFLARSTSFYSRPNRPFIPQMG